MKRVLTRISAAVAAVAAALVAVAATPAAAVPAFAIQTGASCQACHVGGFGPQLTAFGREFKLQGYTLRTSVFNVPISAMVVESYLNTAKAQTPPPGPGFSPNNNVALDQISVFLAGGLGDHLGGFVQTTYDGVGKAWHWDNLDIRAVDTFKFKGAEMTLGVSLNNAPTVQDVWNSLPAWGFPYTSSTLAPGPSASPLLNGALAQTSLGATAYAWIDSEFYLEAGAYGSPGARTLVHLGVDPTSPGSIANLAPYVRAAFQHDIGPGQFEAGVFGMKTDINPGLDRTTGLTDHYTDLGLDGSYIIAVAGQDNISVNARYLHERQALDATCALAAVATGCANASLTDVRIDGSYYWHDKLGLTLGVFDTFGPANGAVYASRTAKPNSAGYIVQLDTTLYGAGVSPLGKRFNARVGVQYFGYTEVDGAAHNIDGAGMNARDDNAVRVFFWAAY